jgi:hypothetical protein
MMLRNFLTSFVSLSGLVSLSYVLGAAAIFFDLPSAPFLRRAFVGAVSWYELEETTPPEEQSPSPRLVQLYKAGQASEGFTLCMHGIASQATLIDMQGNMVHQWHVPFSQIWPDPPHLRGRVGDVSVHFNGGYLYPNGDLVVVLEGPTTLHNSSLGYGLVKLDKDSRVLWKYAEKCHHDLDVAEDGTIYVLVNELVEQVPPALAYIPTPCMVDVVDVISPEGKRKKRIPLLEAIHDSPYSTLLCPHEGPRMSGKSNSAGAGIPAIEEQERHRDVLHANAVKVLSRTLAPEFPLFKAGQLLISLRQLDTLAMLDPNSGKIEWAATGPWKAQHDPTFLENGRLLLFDNFGSPLGSRVLEYHPQTQAFPWSYPGETGKQFFTKFRGTSQRLPNGNTLIVNSLNGEVFEVTPNREVVWSCSFGPTVLCRARRYTAEQLPFLREDQHVYP